MKYVLDSCVALKWELTETDTDRARQLRQETVQGFHELIAPDVFHIEVAHSLTRAERQGRVSIVDGWRYWLSIIGDCPTLFDSMPLMLRAYGLSSRNRIGVYDCLYVALAEREGCALITADTRLITNLQSQFPFITSLATWS